MCYIVSVHYEDQIVPAYCDPLCCGIGIGFFVDYVLEENAASVFSVEECRLMNQHWHWHGWGPN
jgi:hypothetical protein